MKAKTDAATSLNQDPSAPPTTSILGCAADLFVDFDWDAWEALDEEVANLWVWRQLE